MFRWEQGFHEDQMNNYTVRETIQCHNQEILSSHPPGAEFKNAVLEFIANFEPTNK